MEVHRAERAGDHGLIRCAAGSPKVGRAAPARDRHRRLRAVIRPSPLAEAAGRWRHLAAHERIVHQGDDVGWFASLSRFSSMVKAGLSFVQVDDAPLERGGHGLGPVADI
jgi:hypothetical protein